MRRPQRCLKLGKILHHPHHPTCVGFTPTSSSRCSLAGRPGWRKRRRPRPTRLSPRSPPSPRSLPMRRASGDRHSRVHRRAINSVMTDPLLYGLRVLARNHFLVGSGHLEPARITHRALLRFQDASTPRGDGPACDRRHFVFHHRRVGQLLGHRARRDLVALHRDRGQPRRAQRVGH